MATAVARKPAPALPVFNLEYAIEGAFDKYETDVYHEYAGQLVCSIIAGGIPVDQNVVEGWLRTKLGLQRDDLVRQAVAETMVETGATADEAVAKEADKHLNQFKRDKRTPAAIAHAKEQAEEGLPSAARGQLYVEGRQLKACLKEACSIAADTNLVSARGYGNNNKKGLLSFFAETLFVVEDRLHLYTFADQENPLRGGLNAVLEPTAVNQRFVHTFRGSGIQYEEYVVGAVIDFTVRSIHDYSDEEWRRFWLVAQQNGLGASRSQGFGRFKVTRWERIASAGPRVKATTTGAAAGKPRKAAGKTVDADIVTGEE